MSKVYSYLRFSSKAQELGHSKERQLSKAIAYCKDKKLTLETTTFEDLGVSAWKGANVSGGRLGDFLRAVDEGLIPSDSTLLVEHLDRVTRAEPLLAQELFIGIVRRGLTLITLNDEQVYSQATIKGDWTKLLTAVIKLAQANEENEKKSERVKAVLLHQRTNDILSARRCPSWMTVSEDRKSFVLIPEKVALVRRMFSLAHDGYGIYQTAQLLNREGVPHLGKPRLTNKEKKEEKTLADARQRTLRWKGPEINRILRDEAVIGHHNRRTEGKVKENFFPAIIEPHLFHAVGEAISRRNTAGGGRKGNTHLWNLLAIRNLVRCECGEPVRAIRHKTWPHMRCVAALAGACDAPFIAYKPLEEELLSWVLRDANEQLIKVPEPEAIDVRPTLREEIQDRKVRRQRLFDFIEDGKISDEEATERLAALKREIAEKEERLRHLDTAAAYDPEDAAVANLTLYQEHYDAVQDGAPPEVVYAVRNKLQEAIRTYVSEIVISNTDWFKEDDHDHGTPLHSIFIAFRNTPDVKHQLLFEARARPLVKRGRPKKSESSLGSAAASKSTRPPSAPTTPPSDAAAPALSASSPTRPTRRSLGAGQADQGPT